MIIRLVLGREEVRYEWWEKEKMAERKVKEVEKKGISKGRVKREAKKDEEGESKGRKEW